MKTFGRNLLLDYFLLHGVYTGDLKSHTKDGSILSHVRSDELQNNGSNNRNLDEKIFIVEIKITQLFLKHVAAQQ